MKRFFIAMLVVLSFGSELSYAYACNSEIPKLTFVYLSEVNFSYEDGDYIEFFINKPENIEKDLLSIEVDGKNVYEGFELSEYNIIKKDLVSTTEQIFVKYGDEIIDAVCWKNESVSSNEIEEVELFESLDFGDCNDSSEIGKNLHLAKQNLILNKWSLTVSDTPGEDNIFDSEMPKALINIQSGETIGVGSLTINLDGSKSSDENNLDLSYSWDFGGMEKSLKENPDSITFNKAGSYVIELSIENELGETDQDYLFITVLPETLEFEDKESDYVEEEIIEEVDEVVSNVNLVIVDFMANPEGSDSGNEWIDLKNTGEAGYGVSWSLDDSEGQSSPHDLSQAYFESNEITRISNSDSSIGLNNSDDAVRLFKNNELINEFKYEVAKSGISYLEFDKVEEDNEVDLINNYEFSDSIRINELLPNPEGNDSGNEWVEIYNYDETSKSLAGWYLMLNTKKITLDDYSIQTNQHLAIGVSGFSNSGGTVVLYDPNNEMVSSVDYDISIEGQSYSFIDEDWMWSSNITKSFGNFELKLAEGEVESIDEIEQIITISSISLLYENLPSGVEVGGHVNFSYAKDELVSIELDNSNEITLGGFGLQSELDNVEKDKAMWPYIIIYGLAGIIAVCFRKPLFSFVKTKLGEI
jgi:hypothetical protein